MAGEGNFVGLHDKKPQQQARADQFCQDRSLGSPCNIKVGSGKLTFARGDNDFDQVPNLRSGITEVVKMADGLANSSLGTTSQINLGGTLRYIGTGDTSNRTLGLLQTIHAKLLGLTKQAIENVQVSVVHELMLTD